MMLRNLTFVKFYGGTLMVTIESIRDKLGFDPLTHEYGNPDFDGIDDSLENPLKDLSDEELDCIIAEAKNNPQSWMRA